MIPLPGPRGGHALAPKAPKATITKVKAPSMQEIANRQAQGIFSTTLARLQNTAAPVDANAIMAPYRASETIAGQLGTGAQTAAVNAGTAAQAQYQQGLDTAQQHAAQFGIATGAGAQPVANTGAAPLASQTAAYAAAAPAAATQWEQLLERTGANAVNTAQQNRSNSLTAAEQSLAGNLPAIQENQFGDLFKQHVQKFNEGVTKTQLTNAENKTLNDYVLGAAKVKTSAATAAANTAIKREALNEKTATDRAKLSQGQQTIAIRARATQATNKGLKGVAAAVKALTPSASGGGTTKAAKGFDALIQPVNAQGAPLGPAVSKHLPSLSPVPGYKILSSTTHYETVPTSASTTKVTPAMWDAQMRSLLAQNPGETAAIKAFLGPRPKK